MVLLCPNVSVPSNAVHGSFMSLTYIRVSLNLCVRKKILSQGASWRGQKLLYRKLNLPFSEFFNIPSVINPSITFISLKRCLRSNFLREGREQRDQLLKSLPKEEVGKNPLDGCLHVFVDLGSNRGLQIRKLYESHLFPLAPILPLYEKYSRI